MSTIVATCTQGKTTFSEGKGTKHDVTQFQPIARARASNHFPCFIIMERFFCVFLTRPKVASNNKALWTRFQTGPKTRNGPTAGFASAPLSCCICVSSSPLAFHSPRCKTSAAASCTFSQPWKRPRWLRVPTALGKAWWTSWKSISFQRCFPPRTWDFGCAKVFSLEYLTRLQPVHSFSVACWIRHSRMATGPRLVQNGPCFRHGGGVFCVAFVDLLSTSLM